MAGCTTAGRFIGLGGRKRFEFDSDGKFVFLAIADWHRRKGKSNTERELAFFNKAVTRYNPGLVVFAGDNVCCRQNKRGLFEELMTPVVDAFKDRGVPLAVAFGNHDSEHSLNDKGYYSRQEQYDWYRESLCDLFVDYDVPALTGVGTGKIEIFARGVKSPAFKIYLADSGAYAGRRSDGSYATYKGYDNPHRDQIEWYLDDSCDAVPHVWIQHIIVPDVNVNGMLIKAMPSEPGAHKRCFMPDGSEAVLKLARHVKGVLKERTCSPKWNVYRDKDHLSGTLSLYDAWHVTGSMKGAFFGHDHINTFDGVDMNGIRLGMIKSMNCGGSYNDGVAGLRVFTVREDGSYETATVTEKSL